MLCSIPAALLALPLASASTAQESVTLSGHLFDANGAPVEGGDVALMCQAFGAGVGRFNEVDLVAHTISGPGGEIELEIGPSWLAREYGYRELRVAAYAEGHGLLLTEWQTEALPVGQDLTLYLPVQETSEFRLTDDEGQPVAGARVAPFIMSTPSVPFTRLHGAVLRMCTAVSDAAGTATMSVPFRSVRSVTVQLDDGPIQFFGGSNPRTVRTRDLRLASVRKVPIDHGELDVAGVTLAMDTWSTYDAADGVNARRTVMDSVELGAGHASIWVTDSPAVFRMRSRDARSLELVAEFRTENEEDPPQEETGVVVIREPEVTYAWRGAVTDPDGLPAAGVRIHFDALHLGSVVTDAEGRFDFECSRSAGRILFAQGNTEFVGGGIRSPLVFAAAPSTVCKFKPMEVRRSKAVTLQVTDANGDPVPRAYVVMKQRDALKTLTAVTGPDGVVEVSNAVQGLPIEYVVLAKDLHGAGTIALDEANATVRLAPPVRLMGRALIAADGSAASRVRFTLERHSPRGTRNRISSGGSTEVYADTDGSFEFQAPLDPKDKYVLSWGGAAFERGHTGLMTGAELAELDEVEIRRLDTLEVKLEDLSGAPIKGAVVWFRSSRVKSETSVKGTALLEGGSERDRIVIVRTPSGVWHARVVDPDSERLTISVPSWQPLRAFVGPPRIANERRRLAAGLARTRVAELLQMEDTRGARRALPPLCWSDPSEVLGLLEDGHFSDPFSQIVALSGVGRALAKKSPNESLSVSRRLAPGASRTRLVIEAARGLSRQDEFESLAIERSQLDSIRDPLNKLHALGLIAERFVELGRTDAAMPLFEEGKALAETLPRAGGGGFARANFGERLALVDRNAGIALIESTESDTNPDRHFGNIAHKLAAIHPSSAENWLERCESERGVFRAGHYISRVVYHMAPVDLQRAQRLARRYGDTAFAHGMIALALHESGRTIDKTRPILERAFDRLHDRGRLLQRIVPESPTEVAGALLPVAAVIDPDNFGTWLARALAIRLFPDNEESTSVEIGFRSQSSLALFVALYDTELARALVEPCLALPGATRTDGPLSDSRSAWSALAIIDPGEASRRAWAVGPGAMRYVAAMLCRDEEERLFYSLTEVVRLWAPGKEDL